MNEILFGISIWLLPVLFAITLHEAAHGYVAWKLGDDTAKQLGRVSFNPLRERMQRLVDNFFDRDRSRYRLAVREISEAMVSMLSMRSWMPSVVRLSPIFRVACTTVSAK